VKDRTDLILASGMCILIFGYVLTSNLIGMKNQAMIEKITQDCKITQEEVEQLDSQAF
jgi:hypothetical protein